MGIVRLIGSHWKRAILPVFFLLVATGASFLFPLFPKWAMDRIVTAKSPQTLLPLAAAFMVLIIVQHLFSYLNVITFFKFQKESILQIQERLVAKLLHYPIEFFDKNHSGYLMGRIRGDVSGLSYIFSESLVISLMDSIKFIGAFFILFSLNVKLTLICLSILPFLAFKLATSRKNINKVNQAILEENARLEKELSDTLQGVELIKSFSREEEGKTRIINALRHYQKVEVRRNSVFSLFNNTVSFIVTTGQALLLYFGIQEILLGRLSLGGYVAFMGYLLYLYAPMENLSAFMVYVDYAKSSYDRIQELLSILPEDSGERSIHTISTIDVHGLHFAYRKDREVIQNIDLHAKSGDRILVSGNSGSGKSTLMKLLIGLYRPQAGEILYNGINLNELDLKELRRRIAFVSQNIFLFHATVRENIMFGDGKASDERILEILDTCRIKEKVQSLEHGLDHLVSERGSDFSGGEKQRIALARAMVKDPDVIILDEALANIDTLTAADIEGILLDRFRDKIIFKIAHSHSAIHPGWRHFPLSPPAR